MRSSPCLGSPPARDERSSHRGLTTRRRRLQRLGWRFFHKTSVNRALLRGGRRYAQLSPDRGGNMKIVIAVALAAALLATTGPASAAPGALEKKVAALEKQMTAIRKQNAT